VLLNPNNPIDPVTLRQIQAAAAPVAVNVVAFEASDAAAIEGAFAAMAGSAVGALIVAPDPLLVNQARQIAELAAKNRLPAIYPFRPFVEVGGLMCYGQNIYENFGRAASYIDKIFRGAKPGDLPVEQPTQLELVVNRKAAEALGLTVPLPILLRANLVID
jgi:putative tryptophan/tyrosine transport system substrate-binding protein